MRGGHDTGDRTFQISKNKDYLLPLNIVMPGKWEIRAYGEKRGKGHIQRQPSVRCLTRSTWEALLLPLYFVMEPDSSG